LEQRAVNEADKTFIRRPETHVVPNSEEREEKYSVTVAGDDLKTITVNSLTGDKAETIYRRAR
jgi:hypothetical protein